LLLLVAKPSQQLSRALGGGVWPPPAGTLGGRRGGEVRKQQMGGGTDDPDKVQGRGARAGAEEEGAHRRGHNDRLKVAFSSRWSNRDTSTFSGRAALSQSLCMHLPY
jgi:hypothetical protein